MYYHSFVCPSILSLFFIAYSIVMSVCLFRENSNKCIQSSSTVTLSQHFSSHACNEHQFCFERSSSFIDFSLYHLVLSNSRVSKSETLHKVCLFSLNRNNTKHPEENNITNNPSTQWIESRCPSLQSTLMVYLI